MTIERNNYRAADEAIIVEAEAVVAETQRESHLQHAVQFARDLGKVAVSGHMGELMTEALRRPF